MKSFNLIYKSLIGILFFVHSIIVNATTTATTVIDYPSQIERVLGVLLLILAGIFFVAWLMKKMGVAGHVSSSQLAVKASLPLSKKDKLYVIQVGDEQVLIGVNSGAITPLKTLEKPLVDSSSSFTPSSSEFSKKIQAILTQKMTDSKSL